MTCERLTHNAEKFFLGTPDAEIERYLKLFTFLPVGHISSVMAEHCLYPERRVAQHLLASEILELVHGADIARDAQLAHECLRQPTISGFLRLQDSQQRRGNDVIQFFSLPRSSAHDIEYSQMVHSVGITKSKAEAARMIAQGGLSIASKTLELGESPDLLQYVQVNPREKITLDHLIDGRLLILRIGKWKIRIIQIGKHETPSSYK